MKFFLLLPIFFLVQITFAQTPPTTIISNFSGSTSEQVVVNWQYRALFSRYEVYRSDNGPVGPFNYIGERTDVTSSQFANFVDTNVDPSTEYCYQVNVCSTSTCSAPSPTACYTTTAMPPPDPFTVSGTITNSSSGLGGVTVNFNSSQGSIQTTTNSSGNYVLNLLENATGNIVPSLAGYDFSPSSIPINTLSSNLTNQNFVATSNTINAPNVTAVGINPDAVQLNWNSVSGANYYKVFFSNGVEYTDFIQTTSRVVTNLNTNQQHCFYVKAYQTNTGGGLVSPNSSLACATLTDSVPLPTVNLTNPNSGTFTVNTPMNITWNSTNQHHYGLYLYKGGTAPANEIGLIILPPNSTAQSYTWGIPATLNGHTISGNDYKIKIAIWNTGDPTTATSVGDYSANNLTINPETGNTPSVTLNYPTITESFSVGQTINIQWASQNQMQYIVTLYEGGTETGNKRAVVSFNTNSTAQNVSWQIPATTTFNGTTYTLAGSDYKIGVRILNSDNEPAEDFGNQFFAIDANNNCSYTDVPLGDTAYDAVTFLCEEGLLENDALANPNDPINRAALAKLAYLSIGLDMNTVTDIVDMYPSPFQDLQDETTFFYTYAKNLSYLEYGDGKSPFDKTFFNFYASRSITRTHLLKVLLETWNIPLQTGTGLPYTDVPTDHDNFEYIYTAYQLGIIDNNAGNIFGPDVNAYRREAFIMLYRMMDVLPSITPPAPIITDFFITGNYTPNTFATFKGLHSGNFNHYTKTSFAIASVGIPLSFEHSYNSYLSEMPTELAPLMPLGKMWNHTYNSYITEIVGDIENPADFRVVVALPNSGFHIYRQENGQYINDTNGVYNVLTKPTSTKFRITTKNQIVYTYEKLGGTSDDYPFVLVTIHDRNGNLLAINYENSQDANNPFHKRIKEVVGTSGRKLLFAYKPNTNRVDYIQDPLNRKVYYNYGADGKLATFIDAKNQTTTYNYGATYAEQDLLMSIQLPKGNTITNSYESKKLTSSQTNGNQPTNYAYERNYEQPGMDDYIKTTIVDPDNRTTVIDHNRNGNPNHIVKDGNTNVDIAYNPSQTSKPSSITIDGKNAGMQYDTMGNVLSVSLPMGVSYQYTYNNYNDILQYTDPNGHNYNYTYNGTGNLTQTTTPRGSTNFSVNSKGLVISVDNPAGITTSYTYDAFGNIKTTTAPEGIATTANYDIASRLISFTNPNGVATNYQYDPNDNMLLETINGHSTGYTFDPNDNLTTITNANGGATNMVYDFDNDFLTSVNFGAATDAYTYYEDGKVNTYTNPNGTAFTYGYDGESRLITVNGGGDNIAYTYDTHNNIETISNTNGIINYSYDALNRITSTTDYFNNTISYAYDANSNVTRITYPGNKQVDYTYYPDNLLQTVKDWNDQTTTYQYRDDGLLLNVSYANGTYCDYTYDGAGRQTGMAWKKSTNEIINEYAHTLDPIGNHLSETKTEPFMVSTVANNMVAYAYNNTNKLQTANGTDNVSFGYDTNGNTLSKTGNTYTYDAYDRLTGISGAINAQYEYDGLGNRRKSTINGQEKRYVLDVLGMSKVLIETNASNTPDYYYVYGLGLISRIDATNQTNYYHYDFRGSTIAMTDETETITHQYEYNDFGQTLQIQEADFNAYRYVGKYGVAYEDTELYFMRARFYDPSVGRFLSEDPIWSTNLYPYADNNPVTGIDPKGENVIESLISTGTQFHSTAKPNQDLTQVLLNTSSLILELSSVYEGASELNNVKDIFGTSAFFLPVDKLGAAGLGLSFVTNAYSNHKEGLGVIGYTKAIIQTGVGGITLGFYDGEEIFQLSESAGNGFGSWIYNMTHQNDEKQLQLQMRLNRQLDK